MPDQLRKLGVSSIQLPGVNVLLEFADAWERDRQHLANAEAQRDQLREAARNVLSHEHPDGGYLVLAGHRVPVANVPYTLTSDAGHLMAEGNPFAACYWDTPDGRVFSLRSHPDGADVSEIAKQYGGGGHRNAAGFRMPIGWEGEQ